MRILIVCCSLFCFYIKPQPKIEATCVTEVVPYSVSTSNHNVSDDRLAASDVVPYSVSTSNHNSFDAKVNRIKVVPYSVSTSNHNESQLQESYGAVVPYSVSTSNHNAGSIIRLFPASYIVLAINKMDSNQPAKCV